MQLFNEAGQSRVKLFLEAIRPRLIEGGEAQFKGEHIRSVTRSIYDLGSSLLENNSLGYWQEHHEDHLDDFQTLDHQKGTYTPDVYNDESEILFQEYLGLLIDIRNNWSDYVPFMTRVTLKTLGAGVFERIENAIKFMENQLELYHRRALSITPNNNGRQIRDDINQLFSKFEKAIFEKIEEKQHIDLAVVKADFMGLHTRIMQLPLTQELRAVVGCTDPSDYREKNSDSSTSRGKAYFLESLLMMENKMNLLLKVQGRNPIFVSITEQLKSIMNPSKASSFRKAVFNNAEIVSSQLVTYTKGSGHESKRELAAELFEHMQPREHHLNDYDSAGFCLHVLYYLREAQRDHSQILIRESISSGTFGAMLDDGLAVFTRLVDTLSLENDESLGRWVAKSLEVIESEQASVTSTLGSK